jgi:hypothetical protein
VILYGHAPIVAHDVHRTLIHLSRGEVPVTGVSNIGFLNRVSIHEEFPVTKFDAFTFQCDDTLEQHDPVPCKADSHHLMSLGFRKKGTQSPAKINASVVIRGFHAGSLDMDGNQDVGEDKIS